MSLHSLSASLLVFAGAGLGGVSRHWFNLGAARWLGLNFPWGTFGVNVLGSFAMGLLAGWLAFRSGTGLPQPVRLFLATGFLGGFTTFSAYSLDAVLLWERGRVVAAALFAGGSMLAAFAALAAGLAIMRSMS